MRKQPLFSLKNVYLSWRCGPWAAAESTSWMASPSVSRKWRGREDRSSTLHGVFLSVRKCSPRGMTAKRTRSARTSSTNRSSMAWSMESTRQKRWAHFYHKKVSYQILVSELIISLQIFYLHRRMISLISLQSICTSNTAQTAGQRTWSRQCRTASPPLCWRPNQKPNWFRWSARLMLRSVTALIWDICIKEKALLWIKVE